MAFIPYYNLVRLTTPTIGTGTMTLGSPIGGYLTLALAGASDGDIVDYAILDGANSETGDGIYHTAGPTLTRGVAHSTNANTPIVLSGQAQVAVTPRADVLTDTTRITAGTFAAARMALFLSSQNVFTAQQSMPLATLTASASIVWNVSVAQKARCVLGASNGFTNVTNAVEGTSYSLLLVQDGTGSRVIGGGFAGTGAGSFDFGAVGTPSLTTTPNVADLLSFEAISIAGTLKLRYCGIQKGFA